MGAQPWDDARRVEAWAGEVRVNLIRAVALVVFYGHHLLHVYVLRDDPAASGSFHVAATAVVVAWAAAVFVLYACLARRWVPPALKFVANGWDLLMVTLLVMVSPEGPRSPLMFLYFVVIAAAPLRLSMPLVYAATLGAMLGAVLVLGQYVFLRIGSTTYYAVPLESGIRITRTAEVIFVLALGTVGLLAGQVVRQARRLVLGYPVTAEEPTEGGP